MNNDVFEGKWKEMRGQVKEWWGKITDDELEQTQGRADQLVGLIQQHYGYSREQAEEEFERRLRDANNSVSNAVDNAARDLNAQKVPTIAGNR